MEIKNLIAYYQMHYSNAQAADLVTNSLRHGNIKDLTLLPDINLGKDTAEQLRDDPAIREEFLEAQIAALHDSCLIHARAVMEAEASMIGLCLLMQDMNPKIHADLMPLGTAAGSRMQAFLKEAHMLHLRTDEDADKPSIIWPVIIQRKTRDMHDELVRGIEPKQLAAENLRAIAYAYIDLAGAHLQVFAVHICNQILALEDDENPGDLLKNVHETVIKAEKENSRARAMLYIARSTIPGIDEPTVQVGRIRTLINARPTSPYFN